MLHRDFYSLICHRTIFFLKQDPVQVSQCICLLLNSTAQFVIQFFGFFFFSFSGLMFVKLLIKACLLES